MQMDYILEISNMSLDWGWKAFYCVFFWRIEFTELGKIPNLHIIILWKIFKIHHHNQSIDVIHIIVCM